MVKIVVFDSGFGSLSVIKQIRKMMKAQIIYFADQKNFSYGKKSISQLRKIITKTIDSLQKEFDPQVIVVGSNTPSICINVLKFIIYELFCFSPSSPPDAWGFSLGG